MIAGRRAEPRIREYLADALTPLAVHRRLESLPGPRFLLESVTGGDQVSRYSFLGAAPARVLRLWVDRAENETPAGRLTVEGAPLAILRRETSAIGGDRREIPFLGGWVGSFGYDTARWLERLPARPVDPFGAPVVTLARFDAVLVFDHVSQRILAVSNVIEGEVEEGEAVARLDELETLLRAERGGSALRLPGGPIEPPPVAGVSIPGAAFRDAVLRAQEHIAAGDVFQVVLARRFDLGAQVTPSALYRALRRINPSPYMVLWETPEQSLVGASPEALVRKTGRRVETRPIAGTRPRGRDVVADRALAGELLSDAKERAEHVMLVDLGRNDVGRVCAAGSVQVTGFMEVERYSHVMHICSTVEGRLADGRGALDALFSCFPAGTVSGAPKVRAMEIIDALEPEARGPYAGAVGYLSFADDLDACITIRTLVVGDGRVSVTAGAGIVADSDPAAEERETENKAAGLLAAVELARRLERAGDVA